MSYRCFVGFYLCELILQANSCTLSYWNTATTRLQKRYKWMYVFLKMQILAKCRISLQTNTGQHTTMVTTSNRSLYTLLLLFLAVATSCCYSGWSVSRVVSQWPSAHRLLVFTLQAMDHIHMCPFSSGVTRWMGNLTAGNMSCCCVPGCRSCKHRLSDKLFSFHHSPIDQPLKERWNSENLEGF